MGKIQVLTREQQIILSEVGKNQFFNKFYFTGGTALSAFYLQHRYSEDLDFFSEEKFDVQGVENIIDELSKKYKFEYTSEFIEIVQIFMIKFAKGEALKLDFATYPYRKIEEKKIVSGVKIDSLIDIAVNKLHTVNQRTTVKDFVDLYFLLQRFSFWDLKEGIQIKFRQKLEPFIFASDFLKIEEFDTLPRMIKPITLDELKSFFRQKAKEVGKMSIK
ncbi:MAG: nucleotidyl transferase AbiEii/AbiGii toxin family protein [Candidatus Levybacteria bacterium]|nr:nucleotidyl transferase AbiEii/AbiGii toxin family protein [Candidatus Levybacteria bacterium]